MTVKDITYDLLLEWLKEHGYDGLCCEDCGCGFDDIAPCGRGDWEVCVPAYYHAEPHVINAGTVDEKTLPEGWYAEKPGVTA